MLRLWQWLRDNGGPIAVACTLIGGAYAVGLKQGENNLAEVEEFKKTLPPMMENLQKLAGDLAQSTEITEENKRLKAQVDKDAGELAQLSQTVRDEASEIKKQKDTIISLTAQIDTLFPAEVVTKEIALDSAEDAIPNGLTIGVNQIMTIAKNVEATINNVNYSFDVGRVKQISVAYRSCAVKLTSFKEKSATFSVSCGKSSQ